MVDPADPQTQQQGPSEPAGATPQQAQPVTPKKRLVGSMLPGEPLAKPPALPGGAAPQGDNIPEGVDPNPTNQNVDFGTPLFRAGDLWRAPAYGAVEAAKNAYRLADTLSMDYLPDWKENPLPKPQSTLGNVGAALTQFTAGFIGASKALNLLGKAGEAVGLLRSAEATGIGNLTLAGNLAASGTASFVVDDPNSKPSEWMGLKQLLELGGEDWKNAIASVIDSKEDSPELLNRFKTAAANVGLGLIAEPVFRTVQALAGVSRAKAAGENLDSLSKLYLERKQQLAEAADQASKQAAQAEFQAQIENYKAVIQEWERQHEEQWAKGEAAAKTEQAVAGAYEGTTLAAQNVGEAEKIAAAPRQVELSKDVQDYFAEIGRTAPPKPSPVAGADLPTLAKNVLSQDAFARFEARYKERAGIDISGIKDEAARAPELGQMNPKKMEAVNNALSELRDGNLNSNMWQGGRPMADYLRTLEEMVDQAYGNVGDAAKTIVDEGKLTSFAAAINEGVDPLYGAMQRMTPQNVVKFYGRVVAYESLLTGHAKYAQQLMEEAAKSGEIFPLIVSQEEMMTHAVLMKYVKESRASWGLSGQILQRDIEPGSLEAFDKLRGQLTVREGTMIGDQIAADQVKVQKRAAEAALWWRQEGKAGRAQLNDALDQKVNDLLALSKTNYRDAYRSWREIAPMVKLGNSDLYDRLNGVFSKTIPARGDLESLSRYMGDPETAQKLLLASDSYVSAKALRGDLGAQLRRVEMLGGKQKLLDKVRDAASALSFANDQNIGEKMADVMDNIARPGVGRQMAEWWVNDILWNGRTMARVLGSEMLLGGIVRPALRAASGAAGSAAASLAGETKMAQEYLDVARTGIGQLWMQMHPSTWSEAAHFTQQAWKDKAGVFLRPWADLGADGRALLTNDNLRYALKQHGAMFDPDKNPLAGAFVWLFTKEADSSWIKGGLDLGGIARQSGRTLMSIDEFIRQSVGRAAGLSRLQVEAAREFPLDAAKAADVAAQRFQDLIKDGQLLTRNRLVKETMEQAQDFGFRMQHGIYDSKDLEEFAQRKADDQLLSNPQVSSVAQWLEHETNLAAGTLPLDPNTTLGKFGQTIQKMKAEHPALSFLLPFVQTPVNMLQQTIDATIGNATGIASTFAHNVFPGAKLEEARSKLVQQLLSSDPYTRMDALGRVQFGMFMGGSVLHLAGQYDQAGRPFITGSIPSDPKERERWKANNIKPFSFLMPSGEYWSYDGFDPFSMTLGFLTDFATINRYSSQQKDANPAEVALANATLLASNLISRTYMRTLFDFTQAVASREPKTLERFASNLLFSVVPGPFAVAGEGLRSFTDDGMRREMGGMMDQWKQRLGLMHGLEYAYSDTGEKIPASEFYGPDFISPISYLKTKSGPLGDEFFRVGMTGEGLPTSWKGLDLTKLQTADGKSAHERWGELTGSLPLYNGKNLSQHLEWWIQQPFYKNLAIEPDTQRMLPSPRVQSLRSQIAQYREFARLQLGQELSKKYGEDPFLAWEQGRAIQSVKMRTGGK